MNMQLVDLFSGIGGFSLSGNWMGWRTIQFCENNDFCNKILRKHWPGIPIHNDIETLTAEHVFKNELYDPKEKTIVTGGFPCQPFSVAGKQKGKGDDRYLWPEMLRVIREIQPTWVVGENVTGIIKLALEDICTSLEGEGYEVQPFIIPSASIGAWDKRNRVWIIAYNNRFTKHISIQQRGQNKTSDINTDGKIEIDSDIKSSVSKQSRKTRTGRNGLSNGISDTISKGLQGHSRHDLSSRNTKQERSTGQANWLRNWIEVASELCGSNARVSHRMDRIKALGNSVNPHLVFQIFKAIEQYNNLKS